MRTASLLLLLFACRPTEEGIDHSILTGTASIPPSLQEVAERRTGTMNAPLGLGAEESTSLTWRTVVVTSAIEDFVGDFDSDPDADYYAFSPVASGDWEFRLTLTDAAAAGPAEPPSPAPDTGDTAGDTAADTAGDTAADTGDTSGDTSGGDTSGGTGSAPVYVDPIVVAFDLYDAATGDLLLSQTTDASGGEIVVPYTVSAGTTYTLVISAAFGPADTEQPYTLVVPGSVPDDTTAKVGAYAAGEPLVADAPLGGTTVSDWTYDAATWTWSGTWKMMYLRAVNMPETEGGAASVTEGADTVFLRGTTAPLLHMSAPAGTLYSAESVAFSPDGGTQKVDEVIVFDAVAPKVIGKTFVENTPDDTYVTYDGTALDEASLVAMDLGLLSSLGYVDLVDGTIDFVEGIEGWDGNDADVFAFQVPSAQNVSMSVEWPTGSSYDIDIGIFGAYEDYGFIDWFGSFGDSYCMTGADPELCTTVYPLEPETTYYVVVLGYWGAGAEPYHIELEWM